MKRYDDLDAEIEHRLASGWRVESDYGNTVTLVKGQRVNHILHLLLSIVTAGAWLLIWLVLAAFGGERRTTFTYDDQPLYDDQPVYDDESIGYYGEPPVGYIAEGESRSAPSIERPRTVREYHHRG